MASADDLDNQKVAAEKELAELAKERAELEKTLEGTNEKLRKAVLALHDVEKQLPIAKAELANATAASQAAERELVELSNKLADAEAELVAIEQMRAENEQLTKEAHKQMAAMARQAARGDQFTVVGLITGAQSATEFVTNSTTSAAVARAQARNVLAIQSADAAARNTAARINAIAIEIASLKAQAELAYEQRQTAEQAAINKQNEVAKLVSRQQKLTAEIEEQRDEEFQELEDTIADQEAMKQTISELAARQAERDRIIEEKRRQEAQDRVAKAESERKAVEEARRKLQEEHEAQQRAYEEALQAYQVRQQEIAESEEGEAAPEPLPEPVPPTAPVLPDLPPEPEPVAPVYGSSLGWPTDNHTVTSSYGWRYHPTLHYSRLHAGTDLRAPCGVPIYAAQAGIVVKREWYGTGGNMILLDHGKDDAGANIMSRYLHLSAYNVALNQWVTKGQVIGYAGMTGGISTACHLHFELYVNGEHVDPMTRLPK